MESAPYHILPFGIVECPFCLTTFFEIAVRSARGLLGRMHCPFLCFFYFFVVTVGPEYESVMASSTHNVEATGWKAGEEINEGTILFSLARLLTLVEPLKTNLKTW